MARRRPNDPLCGNTTAYFDGFPCPLDECTYQGRQVVAGAAGPGEVSLADLPDGGYVDYRGIPMRVDQSALHGAAGRRALDAYAVSGDGWLEIESRFTREERVELAERLAASADKYNPNSRYRNEIAELYLRVNPDVGSRQLVDHPELLTTAAYARWAQDHQDHHEAVCRRLSARLVGGGAYSAVAVGGDHYRRRHTVDAALALASRLDLGGTDPVARLSPGERELLTQLAAARDVWVSDRRGRHDYAATDRLERRIRDALPPELRARRLVGDLEHTVGYNAQCDRTADELIDLVVRGEVNPATIAELKPTSRRATLHNRGLLDRVAGVSAAVDALNHDPDPVTAHRLARLVAPDDPDARDPLCTAPHTNPTDVVEVLVRRGREAVAAEAAVLLNGREEYDAAATVWGTIGRHSRRPEMVRDLARLEVPDAIESLGTGREDSAVRNVLAQQGNLAAIASIPAEDIGVLHGILHDGTGQNGTSQERQARQRAALRRAAELDLTATIRAVGRPYGISVTGHSEAQPPLDLAAEATEELTYQLTVALRAAADHRYDPSVRDRLRAAVAAAMVAASEDPADTRRQLRQRDDKRAAGDMPGFGQLGPLLAKAAGRAGFDDTTKVDLNLPLD